jgi:sulfur carrier protein
MSQKPETYLRLRINGEERTLSGPMTVAELLAYLEVNERQVGVERNKTLVRKAEFSTVQVADGDELEIVSFVGGG